MDIYFSGEFRSLTPFKWVDVPRFSVITGLNGTGKSQLLKLIHATVVNEQHIRERLEINGETFAPEDVRYVVGEWHLENISAMTFGRNQQEVDNLFGNFRNAQWHINNTRERVLAAEFGRILERTGKDRQAVTRDEFRSLFPEYLLESEERLPYALSKAFYDYRLNEINLKSQGKTSDDVIAEIGNPPWKIVREILTESELLFDINDPEDLSLFEEFELTLTHRPTGKRVHFSELSSGEKVLVSLAFYLFSSREKNAYPKLLLLDEPDAHLHRSMTKQFLEVVENVLVKRYGVRVIITTHSPSTIALSPEDAIFTANSLGERITKTNRDAALKLLTSGVPSFSVNYENRRQVFVESKYDVYYYEKIYRRILSFLEPEVSLTFISSGESRTDKNGQPISSCEQVINITTVLREGGNKFVWGLVDWDETNKESDFVKVMGDGKRYAIENYLFDPLLVAVLLLREKIITRDLLGLDESQTYVDLKYFAPSRLQTVVDFVTNEVGKYVNPGSDNASEHVLLSGAVIKIPDWYTNNQGHELEAKVIEAFPKLNAIKKGTEHQLKTALIDKVIDDVPDLLSMDFVEVFLKLQAV